MPELAEVEYYRKQWNPGLGKRIRKVEVHPAARIFRDVDAGGVKKQLEGAILRSSEAQAKQMVFRFSGDRWLGLHLGMAGRLFAQRPEFVPARHDHLVLYTREAALVFTDYRMFGKVEWSQGPGVPGWWSRLPPPVLSDAFDRESFAAFLARRARSPIKAALLSQERFPGIGNWMADEILWRASIHPAIPAGQLTPRRITRLYRKIREVARDALAVIGETNDRPPDSWLFNHRWKDGGRCPATNAPLQRETIGGRTTCFSPKRQPWRAS